MSKMNLPKQYIHSGVIFESGDVDVKAQMRAAGHPDEVADQAVKDLTEKVEQHKREVRQGVATEQAPITPELNKADGSATAVTAVTKGTDADSTQPAPKELKNPATAPTTTIPQQTGAKK